MTVRWAMKTRLALLVLLLVLAESACLDLTPYPVIAAEDAGAEGGASDPDAGM